MTIEEAVTSEAVMMPMVACYLRRNADGFIPARSPRALLSRDFFGKRLHTRDATVSLNVAEQSCRAVPLAVPARIVVCVEQEQQLQLCKLSATAMSTSPIRPRDPKRRAVD